MRPQYPTAGRRKSSSVCTNIDRTNTRSLLLDFYVFVPACVFRWVPKYRLVRRESHFSVKHKSLCVTKKTKTKQSKTTILIRSSWNMWHCLKRIWKEMKLNELLDRNQNSRIPSKSLKRVCRFLFWPVPKIKEGVFDRIKRANAPMAYIHNWGGGYDRVVLSGTHTHTRARALARVLCATFAAIN